MGEYPVLGFGAHLLRAFLIFDNLLLLALALAVLIGVSACVYSFPLSSIFLFSLSR